MKPEETIEIKKACTEITAYTVYKVMDIYEKGVRDLFEKIFNDPHFIPIKLGIDFKLKTIRDYISELLEDLKNGV